MQYLWGKVVRGKYEFNELFVNALLRKPLDWSYQNEWRLIENDHNIELDGYCKEFCPIKAVYLGFKMPKEERNDIIELCKKRGILVFQMVVNLEKHKMLIDDKVFCSNL